MVEINILLPKIYFIYMNEKYLWLRYVYFTLSFKKEYIEYNVVF